ncbi:hypothetical protein W97_02590 [Coniosporium apollinis CBS 100218]|uniref:Uncharacterized protein n=1 Tax=Coniosporium apollinis (strain CBS 100218) TaxID=1168221 RepID=R7YNB5_CONA1|nr:uncharacterized protein W97_02590 [Coniosporium apollinis CBS 100218]EON63363.1 hypothetical protein W97_02590 [Coniosporium apollinis CBS 100218]
MPTHRSITIQLFTPRETIAPVPEFSQSPSTPSSPASDSASSSSSTSSSSLGSTPTAELSKNETIVSRYIPHIPNTQIWIRYRIKPSPSPPQSPRTDPSTESGTAYYLFKLFVNSVHFVSWCVGEENKWKGTMMYGLYELEENHECTRELDRRNLSFQRSATEDDVVSDVQGHFEIKVFRAKGRKRVPRQVNEFDKSEIGRQTGGGIGLVKGGQARHQPRRFYKFALIAPVDEPYATFRYLYRSWDQLRALGITDQGDPCRGFLSADSASSASSLVNITAADVRHANTPATCLSSSSSSSSSSDGAPNDTTTAGHATADKNITNDPSRSYKRLSIPPSRALTLLPSSISSAATRSTSPMKAIPGAYIESPDLETSDKREWLRHTPSPVKWEAETKGYGSPEP